MRDTRLTYDEDKSGRVAIWSELLKKLAGFFGLNRGVLQGVE